MTTWHPDTCACVLTINPDGETGAVVRSCRWHADKDPVSAFQKVLQHNRNKNYAMAEVAKAGSDAKWNVESDGSLTITLAKSDAVLEQALNNKYAAKTKIDATVQAPARLDQ